MGLRTAVRSVLVPLDGSETAEQALPVAADLARRAEASLHLVTVCEPLSALLRSSELSTVAAAIEKEAETRLTEYLQRAAAKARAGGAPNVVTAVLHGAAADELAGYARREGTDLVAMTTHGRGGVSRFWFGSVADRLLRQSGAPILLLHPQDQPQVPAYRRILVALDGQADQDVLAPALALGSLPPKASFVLARVLEPVLPMVPPLPVQPPGLGRWVGMVEASARSHLARLADRLRGDGVAATTQVLVGRPVADQLLALARTMGVDLIALGTHGAGGLERLVLGSVADKVVRGSQVPVLVAPVQRFQARLPGGARRQRGRAGCS